MRWRNQRQSGNVEDRRGVGGKGIAIGGGGIGVLVLVIAVVLCGGDPQSLFRQSPGGPIQPSQKSSNAGEDDLKKFASSILASTEDVWNDVFRQNNLRYREPTLVLFTSQVKSACGYTSSATGPFYCPGDNKLYLDFAFFRELKTQFRAPGDFAAAYVIAHEVGHHVQNQLGTMDQVTRRQARTSKSQGNKLSVQLELQADCFAGIWAAAVKKKGLLEGGDAEEAIRAAAAVGDDMIQKRARGYVVPESFTHGSARQRVKWYSKGFNSGDVRQCRFE